MGLTKEYFRYSPAGISSIIGSANSNLACISNQSVAVGACENVFIWDTKTAEKVGTLHGPKEILVSLVEYSPGTNQLAVGYSDGSVKIFSVENPEEELIVFSGHKIAVSALSFNSTGLLIASGGKDSAVIVWDVVNECGRYRLNGHKGPITKAQFAVQDKFLISCSKDSFVKFWDLSSQHCFFTITDHRTEVWDFLLLKNDSLLLTGSSELELRVYSLDWLKETGAVKSEKIQSALLDDDYQDLLSCTRLGSLLRQSKGRVSQLSLSRDERIMICQGTGQALDVYRIFDAEETRKKVQKKLRKAQKRRLRDDDGQKIESDEEEMVPISEALVKEITNDLSAQFHRLGDFKLSAKTKSLDFFARTLYVDGTVKYRACVLMINNSIEEIELWEDTKGLQWEACERLKTVGHHGPMRCMSFSHDNASFLSGSQDGLKLWNRNSLMCVRSMESRDVLSVIFVPGDRHCVAGLKSGEVCLLDLGSGELFETQKGHEGAVWSMALASDEKSFASCGADKKVKFWNFDLVSENGRNRLILVNTRNMEVSDDVLCIGFSGNGKFLAVGLLDNTAKVFFVDSLKFFLSLYGHSLPVLCLDMSSDSKMIVTGSADKNVKIWGLDFGDCHKSIFAHDDSVTCVKFVPKSHWFFTAGKDGKIKQWDGDKFLRIQVLSGHNMEIWGLAMSQTGSFLVSCSHDRTIRLWERTEELLILDEEQETEREESYEKGAAEHEDVVPGETQGEAALATKKTVDTVKAAELIVEAVDICRSERLEMAADPKHTPHPMISGLGSTSLEYFLLDIVRKIRSSELEKSLLMVPFGYVLDVLKSLAVCVDRKYHIELACRVIFFLIKVNHNQLVNSAEAVPVMEKLKNVVPNRITDAKDVIGRNLAALRFLQMGIEEQEDVQLFAESFEKSQSKRRQKKKRQEAFVMTVS